jgi:hypothetical protein
VTKVARLNRALDAGAREAWLLEPALIAVYAAAIKAAYRRAARRLVELDHSNPDDHSPLTSAAGWSKPDPDELGLSLREQMDDAWENGKVEPIRADAMQRVTAAGLQTLGISFDLRNPAVQGVLKQLGQKIVGIKETTRAEIMGVVDAGWEKGWSIPRLARELVKVGDQVSLSRATTIARTELIGAVNGGSHAVAALVAEASGPDEPALLKIWLTAEDEKVRDSHADAGDTYGAGSGIPLDEPFEVGDDALMYPGDQDGSAEEVINCRCAVSYEEAEQPGGGVGDVSPDATAIADEPDAETAAATIGGTMTEHTWNGRALVATGGRAQGNVPVYALADAAMPEGAPAGAQPIGLAGAREWTAVLCLEGVPTGDGRLMAVDSIGWRELPLTLMALVTSDHGGGASPVAIIAGRIDEIDRMPASKALSAGLLPELDGGYPDAAVAIVGKGVFDDSFTGDEVMRLVGDKTLRGISVDLAVDGQEVVELEPAEGQDFGELLFIVTAGKIMGATVCPFPAFAEATITVDDVEGIAAAAVVHVRAELKRTRPITAAVKDYSGHSMVAVHPSPDEASQLAVAGGQPAGDMHCTLAYFPNAESTDFAAVNRIVAKVAGAHPTLSGKVGGAGYFAPDDAEAKPKAAEPPADEAKTAAAEPAPVADPETDADDEGEAQAGPLHPHVALADVPGLSKMRAALCNAFDDAGVEYATNHDFTPHLTLGYESAPATPALEHAGKPLTFSHVVVHEGLNRTAHPMDGADSAESGDGITASAAGLAPLKPPSSWFADPELGEPTPLTVTDEGRIYGHLATWGMCHTGHPGQCVEPPTSPTDYAYFNLGAVETVEGELVPCGTITLDTGHADLKLSSTPARMHYDHTGTAAADVRCGEDEHGIWFAGAIRPELDAFSVRKLRAAQVSGDWRPIGGHHELIAALSVNVPGFPVVRPRAAIAASGAMLGLVAAGVDLAPTDRADRTRFLELAERARPGYLAAQREALAARLTPA